MEDESRASADNIEHTLGQVEQEDDAHARWDRASAAESVQWVEHGTEEPRVGQRHKVIEAKLRRGSAALSISVLDVL